MAVSYNRLWKLLIDKGITKPKCGKKRVSVQAYLRKWARMKPYQWTRWREFPPLWNAGLTK